MRFVHCCKPSFLGPPRSALVVMPDAVCIDHAVALCTAVTADGLFRVQERDKAEVRALRKTQVFKARRAPDFEKVWQKQARCPSPKTPPLPPSLCAMAEKV